MRYDIASHRLTSARERNPKKRARMKDSSHLYYALWCRNSVRRKRKEKKTMNCNERRKTNHRIGVLFVPAARTSCVPNKAKTVPYFVSRNDSLFSFGIAHNYFLPYTRDQKHNINWVLINSATFSRVRHLCQKVRESCARRSPLSDSISSFICRSF